MIAVDTTTAYMVLDYSDATANGTGLSWNGGGGGIGVYIEPPFYPARVKDTRFYHTSGGTPAAGFAAVIFDDDGPNGGPGTLLDSVFVTPGSFALNAYKSVNTANTVIIDSGGVYLYWAMGGPGIQLARDIDKPISLRTYEILGGSWSGYRDMNTEDFLIGMRVSFARPFADFIYNKTNDPSVSFTDKSTNDPTSWFWDFGDGNTDTLQNPTHVYLDNDTFTVCLTATNQYGSDSVCKTVIIDGVIPTADFRWDSTGTKTIIFFDKSTNDPTGWHWDFNVGPGDTANIQNTAYKYEANGMYNVCLIAKNKNGASAPACQTVEIIGIGINEMHGASIDVYPNPMADYTTVRLSPEIQSDQIKIKLLNVLGNEVSTRIQKNGNVYMIFRDQLVPGMYIIEISSADKVLTRMSLQVAE
jgi:PKD repeat protein